MLGVLMFLRYLLPHLYCVSGATSQCNLKNPKQSHTHDQICTHTYYITKWGGMKAQTKRSSKVSEAQRLPLTLQPLQLRLKSQLLPCPPSPAPSSAPSASSHGMLSAHYPALPTQRCKGVKVQRSALNIRPLRFPHDTSFIGGAGFLLGLLVFH